MLEVKTAATTSLTPDQVIAAAADFSDAREKLWSNCKNRYLQVHDSGADFAEVTEGFRLVTVFWERSRYDWSQPGTIRQTVIDSNVVGPRCTWELTATPNAEGCEVVMRHSREFQPSLKGSAGRSTASPGPGCGARISGTCWPRPRSAEFAKNPAPSRQQFARSLETCLHARSRMRSSASSHVASTSRRTFATASPASRSSDLPTVRARRPVSVFAPASPPPS